MKIQESAENYLETILMLGQKKGRVRSIDIAHELEFKKPSVSVAMKNLRENGYIQVDEHGFITLTDSGRRIAETMYERHLLLSHWLTELGVNEKTGALFPAICSSCKRSKLQHGGLSAVSFKRKPTAG